MYKRLIPSILLQNRRLVKGVRYTGFKDAGGPATTARAHNAQSADELIVCDITSSKASTEPDYETLSAIAEECFMPLTIFGGINSLERAEKAMETGADKIGMTTAAYDHPELIEPLAHRYGAQAVVLGLDVIRRHDGRYALFDFRKGSEWEAQKTPMAWAKEAVERGCGEIRLMAVHREGTMQGFDLELYEALRAEVDVPIILEGGAESLEHIEDAYNQGVEAVAVGAMLVFTDANLVKIKQHMRSHNIRMRN